MQYSDADPISDSLAAFRSAEPQVLDGLYQAATGQRAWSEALAALVKAATAHSAALALLDQGSIVARVRAGTAETVDGERFQAHADLKDGRQVRLCL